MISFGAKYWFILLLSIAIATIVIVLLLYFKNKENKELTKTQIWILSVLRFLSVFTVSFLLLSPFVKNLKKVTQKPIIITAWDNSESIVSTPDSIQTSQELNHLRNTIFDGFGDNYTVVEYTFGENSNKFESLKFSEKKSDYSELISAVSNNHFNQNIGALIIAGDGIYNQGKNPANLIEEINFPVYTIGVGDTSVVVDSRISNIRTNRTSFSGNRFPVEVDVQFFKLKGRPLKLSIRQKNQELSGIVVTPPNDNYFYSTEFVLEAGNAGIKHYTVQIEAVENERNIKNNTSDFVINVLENKQKILFLSEGPHPDIGAIKNTLDLQKTYEVSVFTQQPYPSNLEDFNLLILNQLPTSGQSISEILKTAENNRIPTLFIIGNKTFIPQLNALNTGAVITPLAGSDESAQATLNTTYAIFNLSSEFKELLPKFPPLQVPFAEFELVPELTTLFYQKLLNIETSKPLIATGNIKGRKTGFIFGEGIWRWRLYDYYINQDHARFNELVNQLVQYLALRENEDNFIIDYQSVYTEVDEVVLNAEVYNDAFERITSEEVTIDIQNTNGEEFNFTFDIQGNNYYLNAGHLPTGDYFFSSKVDVGNESFSETGGFTIVPVNIENVVTRANHGLLYQMAANSNGKFYNASDADQIISDIKNNNQLKTTSYFQELVHELLNLHWLFFVFLFLLSMEWFLRKFWGIY